ncbi:hypothetical protein Patl1_03806 [Pistacia atlantica]|uniref:Uncharacterized protein n=1 Tax=Pistacia atlantica TaxID=434234 RepID=A0ACC1BQY5_9ROSI|nr:hypothetical protein Patl1_03806 [Pistacia atlantica]
MEESEEILLSSLQTGGVSIPDNVLSIKDLTPSSLVSICGQSLNLLNETSSFCTSMPDSMGEKFKICTEISLAIKNLGYIGDISYYKFLHPSEDDLYKLIRFLVERLSELPKGIKVAENEVPESVNYGTETVSTSGSYRGEFIPPEMEEAASGDVLSSGEQDFNQIEPANILSRTDSTEEPKKSKEASRNKETVILRDDKLLSASEQKETSLSSKIRNEAESLHNPEEFMEAVIAKTSKSRNLEEEFDLLKAAAGMALDDSHPIAFYLEQLDEQINTRKCNLVEIESQWDESRKSLEEKKRSLEESILANDPEAQEKLQKLREVELERQSVLSEIRKREDEYSKLSAELEKQPKVASRRSYIERVKEITKNSRKQDADIERILKETRELQLESNSIQESLHRTYAIVDEMVFREAKKDSVGRQAYRLLTSIHGSFEQVSEKILATDRIRREITEYEKKLAAMASRSLNVDKLQADLDAILKENEHLEQCHKEYGWNPLQ